MQKSKKQIQLIAKKFLEYHLDIEPNTKNVRRFSAHILVFEKQLKNRHRKRGNIMKSR